MYTYKHNNETATKNTVLEISILKKLLKLHAHFKE
jgi:hypothetical protein